MIRPHTAHDVERFKRERPVLRERVPALTTAVHILYKPKWRFEVSGARTRQTLDGMY